MQIFKLTDLKGYPPLDYFSPAGFLRPLGVRGEGDPGYLRPPLHDGLPDDHQGESPAHGEDAAHQ